MAAVSVCRGFARELRRAPASGTLLPQVLGRHVVCPRTARSALTVGNGSVTRALQLRSSATSQQDSCSLRPMIEATAASAVETSSVSSTDNALPAQKQLQGQLALTTTPGLALAAVPFVPAEYTETVWWAFESCVGVGDMMMGLGGLAAQVFFIVPSTVMMRIMQEKSVGSLPLLPYSALFANGTIWVTYGALLGNAAIWLPNMPAVFFGAVYTAIYVRNCPPGANFLPHTPMHHAAGVAGIVSVVLGSTFLLESSAAAQVVGVLGNVVCVVMFAGPLVAIKTVLQEKSTRSLPLGMCIMTVVNCSLWTFYGAAMLHDPLIWFPNSLGLLSGIAQLGLFMRFGVHR